MLEGLDRFSPYKALIWRDRIEEIVAGGFPPPAIMHVYPTNRCTSNCPFCIMKEEKDRYPGDIDKDVLYKTILDAEEFGVKCIHFSGGGEPLLHPDIYIAMQVAKESGLEVVLSTNFQPRVDLYSIVKSCDHVRVSLNAADDSMYCTTGGYVMGGQANEGKFDLVCERIKQLVGHSDRPDVGVAMLVNPQTADSVYDFCELANRLGVDFVHIRPEFSHDRQRNRAVRASTFNAFRLVELAISDFPDLEIYAMSDKFRGYWSEKSYNKCRACLLNVVVKADATLCICQDVLGLSFGSLENESFNTLWGSQTHREMLDSIDLNKCPRCVLENANEIIQRVFVDDEMRRFLL